MHSIRPAPRRIARTLHEGLPERAGPPRTEYRRHGPPGGTPCASAAELAHTTAYGSNSVLQAVLARLMERGQEEQLAEVVIGGAGAQRRAQVHFAVRHQAGP